MLNNPAYIVSSGSDTAVLWGGLLELINALACIGTAVVLFPAVKRQNEAAALGFVTCRMLEAAIIVIGVVSILTVVTHRQDLAGAAGTDAAALATTGHALVAIYDWAFLLGPGVMPAVNALLLGYLLYRSGRVPRVIPLMGLIGAPLLLTSAITTMFGINEQVSLLSGSRSSRSSSGSCRSASTWWTRASGRHPSSRPTSHRPQCQCPSPEKHEPLSSPRAEGDPQ